MAVSTVPSVPRFVPWASASGLMAVLLCLGLYLSSVIGSDADLLEAAFLFAFLLYGLVGALVIRHRPAHLIGWLLLLIAIAVVGSAALDAYAHRVLEVNASDTAGSWARWAQNWLFVLGWSVGTTFPLFLLPDGRLPSARWRPVMWAGAVLVASALVVSALVPGRVGEDLPTHNPVGVESWGGVLALLDAAMIWVVGGLTLLGVAALVVRWRSSSGKARRQLAWLLLAVVLVALLMCAAVIVDGMGMPEEVGAWLVAAAMTLFPAALAVAILREGLLDIEVVLSRALIYGGASVVIVMTYAVALVLASRWFSERADVAASLVATVLVVLALSSVKDRLERTVRRMLFGAGTNSYELLARMSATVDEFGGTDELLGRLVRDVRSGLHLRYVAIQPSDGRPRIAAGRETLATEGVCLTHDGHVYGELLVATAEKEPLSLEDQALLESAAVQIAGVLRSAGLASELQASRERLVRTREAERLRIRRDLHDGIGPVLAAATLQVDSLRRRLPADDLTGIALADRVKDELGRAVGDVRTLLDGLRPPALDQLGLLGAFDEQFLALRDAGVEVTRDMPDTLPWVGPAVEVAAYLIVSEALTNVLRHSDAGACVVRLVVEGDTLDLEVIDDGIGLTPDRVAGVGMESMAERAAEVGGTFVCAPAGPGVKVHARLPLGET